MKGALPDNDRGAVLREFVATLISAHTEAIFLAGSTVYGNATPFSDIDLAHIVTADYTGPEKKFYYRDGRLISVSARTFDWWRRAMTQPERAIFIVPAMQAARAVFDPRGLFAAYQAQVAEFVWEPLQDSANRFAGAALSSQAETVHKVLSALVRGEGRYEPTVRLTLDMTGVMAVQRGVMIDSAASYMAQVRESVGRGSVWSTHHRTATGECDDDQAPPTVQQQAQAAIRLYRESFRLIESTMLPDRRALAQATVDVIDTVGQAVL